MKFRFFRNQDGAAAIEFGLVAPVIAAVLIGISMQGGQILAYNKMRQAVSSGAQYAMTVDDDTDEIEDVVEAAWEGMPAGATVDATLACYCEGVDSVCTAVCASGDFPHHIITISASRSYEGLAGTTKTLETGQEVRTQ
jgi:Flp pilus assembly protein TadG